MDSATEQAVGAMAIRHAIVWYCSRGISSIVCGDGNAAAEELMRRIDASEAPRDDVAKALE